MGSGRRNLRRVVMGLLASRAPASSSPANGGVLERRFVAWTLSAAFPAVVEQPIVWQVAPIFADNAHGLAAHQANGAVKFFDFRCV